MKVQPINNTQQPGFKAKFPKQDINTLISDIEFHDASLKPKLYTLLEYMQELGGDKANIVTDQYKNYYQIQIDGKLQNLNKFMNAYSSLYSTLVEHKDSIVTNSKIVRMPESVFEQKWWANRHKKESDIKNFSYTV